MVVVAISYSTPKIVTVPLAGGVAGVELDELAGLELDELAGFELLDEGLLEELAGFELEELVGFELETSALEELLEELLSVSELLTAELEELSTLSDELLSEELLSDELEEDVLS